MAFKEGIDFTSELLFILKGKEAQIYSQEKNTLK